SFGRCGATYLVPNVARSGHASLRRHAMQHGTLGKMARVIGMWIPAILLVLIFAKQGWSKFDDASGWARAFRHWGYPDWFRITIGVMESSAVVLLILGRTAAFGAILIIIVMLGGMATHI